MGDLVDFIEYKTEQNRKLEKERLIAKINEKSTDFEVNYAFFELLDLFCQKYHPEIYWEFDLFVNGKLK